MCDIVVMMLFYGCGLWIFEVLGLNVEDYLLFDVLCIVGKGNKECFVFVIFVVCDVVVDYVCQVLMLFESGCFLFIGVCGGWLNVCYI